MRGWLASLGHPELPASWQQVAAGHYQLQHGAEAIHVELKQPRQTRRASVRAHGQGMVVCVPAGASQRSIHRTLTEFEPWIRGQWARMLEHTVPLLAVHETSTLPLFDASLAVEWIASNRVGIERTGEVLRVAVTPSASSAQIGQALVQFYESESRNRLAPLLRSLQDGMPRMPARIRFARVRSIWGSMNSKGVLTLEQSLAIAPSYVFEYLVVHELCHLLEMNHSRAFWRHVAARCPQYRDAEAFLKQHGNQTRMSFDRITVPERFIWK